jgi:hypothetical protein
MYYVTKLYCTHMHALYYMCVCIYVYMYIWRYTCTTLTKLYCTHSITVHALYYMCVYIYRDKDDPTLCTSVHRGIHVQRWLSYTCTTFTKLYCTHMHALYYMCVYIYVYIYMDRDDPNLCTSVLSKRDLLVSKETWYTNWYCIYIWTGMTCEQVWNKCLEIYAKSYDLLSGAHGNVQVP